MEDGVTMPVGVLPSQPDASKYELPDLQPLSKWAQLKVLLCGLSVVLC